MDQSKEDAPEPIEVRVNPESIEMVSYPGPEPSIRNEQLKTGRVVPRRYRNRRIGDLLKELELTEGRGTGFPKIERAMERNGSSPAVFSTDESRSHFLVTLPVHPEMVGVVGKSKASPNGILATDWMDERAKAVGHVLTERQREILDVLATQNEMALSAILKRLSGGPAQRTIQMEMRRLRDVGLVFTTGEGRGVVWSIQRFG